MARLIGKFATRTAKKITQRVTQRWMRSKSIDRVMGTQSQCQRGMNKLTVKSEGTDGYNIGSHQNLKLCHFKSSMTRKYDSLCGLKTFIIFS